MDKSRTDSLFGAEKAEQVVCGHVIRVAFESAVDREFDYAVPDEIWPVRVGQRVEAPCGRQNKPEIGFCVAAASRCCTAD
jgi:hypothetical protein